MYRLKDTNLGGKAQDFDKATVWLFAVSTETTSNPLNGVCCILGDGDLWSLCNDLVGKLDSWVYFCL